MVGRKSHAKFLKTVLLIGVALTNPFYNGSAAETDFQEQPSSISADERTVPVLCYHRFGKYPVKDSYAVSLEEFSKQMEEIRLAGRTPITASQWLEGREHPDRLPDKPVLITVDDGYRDFYDQARPILNPLHFKATLFVYTQFINSKHGLSREQLAELSQAGFEIGSHSATHPKLTQRLAGESESAYTLRLEKELKGSREKLQAWTATQVNALAYPYGLWDQKVARAAGEAGYKLLFTVDPGANRPDSPPESLKRHLVLRGTRLSTFRGWLEEKPLDCEAMTPGPGPRIAGPLARVEITLRPEMRAKAARGVMQGYWGANPLHTRYNKDSGKVWLDWSRPWNQGANLLSLTLRETKPSGIRTASWLLIVDPQAGQKGE